MRGHYGQNKSKEMEHLGYEITTFKAEESRGLGELMDGVN